MFEEGEGATLAGWAGRTRVGAELSSKPSISSSSESSSENSYIRPRGGASASGGWVKGAGETDLRFV